MHEPKLSDLSTHDLTSEVKRLKSFSIMNAVLIGFLFGIILYSVFMNTWGLVTIIPLYLIHKFVNDPRNKRLKEIEKILEDRKLNN